MAEKAQRLICELYAIEAEIRSRPAEEQRAARKERSKPLVEGPLHTWLTAQLERVSGTSNLAEVVRYALRHWQGQAWWRVRS